jgi:hypothetical protein
MERAERKMVRGRLEGMSVKRLREFAASHGVDLYDASTHLCIVNTLMNNYDKWGGANEQAEGQGHGVRDGVRAVPARATRR